MLVDLVNRSRPKLYITENDMRRTTEGSLTSYLVLGAGTFLFAFHFLKLRFLFEGWLTALCRPQVRGRQCAVNVCAIQFSFCLYHS